MTLAPVYDCGSSLYPKRTKDHGNGACQRAGHELPHFEIPTSAIMVDGKKIKSILILFLPCKMRTVTAHCAALFPGLIWKGYASSLRDTPLLRTCRNASIAIMLEKRRERILDYSLEG